MSIWVVVLSMAWFGSCNGQTIAHVNNLTTTLLTGYNKHARPINDQSQVVNVSIRLGLLALRDFDEVLGKLSTTIVFGLRWTDASMVWDSSLYDGMYRIKVSQDDVWKPPLTLANPFDELKELGDKNWVTIDVQNDGQMDWEPINAIDTTCSIDSTYYPYDKQTCKIEMFTFGYEENEILMNIWSNNLYLKNYEGHATWNILSGTVTKGTKNGERTLLVATLTLERQPTFIIVNFMIPILVLALLNPLVFLLPTDSGERVGYSITILLSITVFMSILADYIPQNAKPMSLGAYMLMVLYISSASMVLCVIISIKIYFISETKPINYIERALVRIFSRKAISRVRLEHVEINSNVTKDINKKDSKAADDIASENNNMKPNSDVCDITWKDVSHAFDICSFIFMYMVIAVAITVFLSILQNGN